MHTLFEEWSEEHTDSPLPMAVRALVETSMKAHAVEPELHKVLIEQVPRVGDLARIGRIEDRAINLVRAYLELRTAEIVPEDPDLAAFVVMRTVEALTHDAVLGRPGYLKGGRLVEEVVGLVLRCLAPDIRAIARR